MKYLLIILISLISLAVPAQDILESEREPIVVETKADLQTELELLPIKYQRDEKPDSLQKFNYSYHGRPLKSDFMLFPEGHLTNYLNLSSGSHDLFGVRNALFIKNYSLKLDYLYRQDEGDRKVNSFSMQNKLRFKQTSLALSADYLDSKKETNTQTSNNKSKNIALTYSIKNSELKYINKFSVKGQFERNSPSLTQDQENYWNIFSELEVQPLNNIFTNLKYSNNHKDSKAQIQLFYQNYTGFGLWSGLTKDKAVIAPYLKLYLNFSNFTFKLTNRPYTEEKSFVEEYKKHPYGNYSQEKTDFFVPGNANAEISYFNFLTWSIGSNYKYALDAPIYRLGSFGQGIYNDSYWETSHYAKASYQNKKINLSTKGEIINHNDMNTHFLPFRPELRISNSASLNLKKFLFALDYIFETKARDDYNDPLQDSHILNAQANYQINNNISLWSEFTNLLDKNSNNYFQDQINQREFKAGIKLFF